MKFFDYQRYSRQYAWLALASFAMSCSTNTTRGLRPTDSLTLPADQVPYGASPDERLRIRMQRAVAISPMTRVSRQSARATLLEFERAATDAVTPTAPNDAATLQNVVRGNFRNFVHCYEEGLRKNPDLRGGVKIKITVDIDGKVTHLADGGSDMPDTNVTSCVIATFSHLVFPKREHPLTIVYPVRFSPAEGPPPDMLVQQDNPDIAPPKYSAPHVALVNSQIVVDGRIVATTEAIGTAGKVQIINGLFQSLDAQRRQWLSVNPGATFPGIAGLRIDLQTSGADFKNIFQTIAQAGYPDVFLQDRENPASIVEIGASVVGESAFEPPKEIIPELHAVVDDTHIDLFWQRGLEVITQECHPPEQLDSATICESWKKNGYKRHLNDDQQDLLVIHTRGNQGLRKIIKVIETIESCTREVRDANYHTQSLPVFWIVLSIR